MITMAVLTEHQMVPIADPTGAGIDNAAAEIVSRVGGILSHASNENSLSSELAAIAGMTYTELHLAWRRHYRAIPPKKMSRDILELGIAWRIQESKLGGLGAAVKRQIAELARTMEANSDLAKPREISLKSGSKLLRTWEGVTHEVLVVEDGFLWAGRTWRSLSVIAREITGTRWSGPRFFGLTATTESDTSNKKAKASDHE
jgi:hypothetical protein